MDSDTDILDLRGLKCPLPALMAKRAVLRAEAGTIICLIADDPLAKVDVTYMCDLERFEIISTRDEDEVLHMAIRRIPPML